MATIGSRPVLLAAVALASLLLVVGVALALTGGDDSEPLPEATATAQPSVTPVVVVTTAPVATLPASPLPATPTPQPSVWTIELLQTGGFAGLARQITIQSTGEATFEDQRSQRVVTRALTGAELSSVAAAIVASGFFEQPATQGATCADCFQLKLTLTMNGRTHVIIATDPGLSASLSPLTGLLTSLLQAGLQ